MVPLSTKSTVTIRLQQNYWSTYQQSAVCQSINFLSVHFLDFSEYKTVEASLIAGERIDTQCSKLIEKCRELDNDVIRLETQMLYATYLVLSKQNKKAIEELTKILDEGDKVDPRVSR